MKQRNNVLPFFLASCALSTGLCLVLAGCGNDTEAAGGAASTSTGTTGTTHASTTSATGSTSVGTTATSSSTGGLVAPDISGAWVSPCIASPQEDGSVQHFDLTFDIGATDWSVDYVVYGDDACAQPFFTVHIDGPYELTAPSTSVSGAWEGTFSFDEKTVTAANASAQGFLESLPSCGTGSFPVDSASDVLTAGCPSLGVYPGSSCPADFDLVLRDATTLRFGNRPADNDMCTPAKRPTMVSEVVLTEG